MKVRTFDDIDLWYCWISNEKDRAQRDPCSVLCLHCFADNEAALAKLRLWRYAVVYMRTYRAPVATVVTRESNSKRLTMNLLCPIIRVLWTTLQAVRHEMRGRDASMKMRLFGEKALSRTALRSVFKESLKLVWRIMEKVRAVKKKPVHQGLNHCKIDAQSTAPFPYTVTPLSSMENI